jgi:hypothetical protein
MGFVPSVRRIWRLNVGLALLWAGCSLNPQPLPPDRGQFGNGSSSSSTAGGSTGGTLASDAGSVDNIPADATVARPGDGAPDSTGIPPVSVVDAESDGAISVDGGDGAIRDGDDADGDDAECSASDACTGPGNGGDP